VSPVRNFPTLNNMAEKCKASNGANDNSADIIPNEKTHLLDELQNLLEKQIELTHQGNPDNRHLEPLSKQADLLVEKIAQEGILELPEFKNRREHLQKLYQHLCLVITAQKTETVEELSRVRKGKKTVGIYRNNIIRQPFLHTF
jgi:hypothetical protein